MASKKKAGNRIKVTLVCSECKRKNYTTMKNKKNTAEKLELSKYCSHDRKRTPHKEGKI
jgi:large subunit ribosomal protein L33